MITCVYVCRYLAIHGTGGLRAAANQPFSPMASLGHSASLGATYPIPGSSSSAEDRRPLHIPRNMNPSFANSMSPPAGRTDGNSGMNPSSGSESGGGSTTGLLMERIEANRAALQQLYALNAPLFQEYSGLNSNSPAGPGSSAGGKVSSAATNTAAGSTHNSGKSHSNKHPGGKGGSDGSNSHGTSDMGRQRKGAHSTAPAAATVPAVSPVYGDRDRDGGGVQSSHGRDNTSGENRMSYYDSYQPVDVMPTSGSGSGSGSSVQLYAKHYQQSKSRSLQQWYERQGAKQ